jgi:hypothetical protein
VRCLVRLVVYFDTTAQAKIPDLHLAPAQAHKDVRRFQVPMKNVPTVEM